MKLRDSEVEEEASIKWWDYEIETLLAIRGKMEEDFVKSIWKCMKSFDWIIDVENLQNRIQIGLVRLFERPWSLHFPLLRIL